MKGTQPNPPTAAVSAWRSIRTRLSGVLVLFCFCVVLFVSWHNSEAFERFLGMQIEDTLVRQARFAGDGISEHLKYASSQTVTLAQRLASEPPTKYPVLMRDMMAGDKGIQALAFMTIGHRQAPKILAHAAIKDGKPELWTELTGAAKTLGKKRQTLVNLESGLGQPLVALMVRFAQGGQKPDLALAVVLNKNRLLARLDATGGATLRLLDGKGQVVVATTANTDKKGPAPLVKAAQGADAYGFRRDYLGNDGRPFIGAFAKISGFDHFVTAERDASLAAREVSLIARRTMLWGFLIIVVAAAFAYLLSGQMTAGVMRVIAATRQLAGGNLEIQVPSSRRDELGLLAHAVNDMGRQIKSLLTEQLEKARLARELDTAKIVQSSFFPKAGISRDGLVVSGSYEPASECGGDWWGVHRLGDHHRLICIADAMGHGVPAALVTAMAYAAFTIVADTADAATSPTQFLSRLNNVIYQAYKGSLSMTCFVAVIDVRDGHMRFANAGHCFPYLLPGDAADERWKRSEESEERRPHVLRLPGTPLGFEAAPAFKEREAQLAPGDRLVLYTDGLVEARGSKDESQWGAKALMNTLAGVWNAGADALHQRILKDAKAFIGERKLDDDITLVVVERPRGATARTLDQVG